MKTYDKYVSEVFQCPYCYKKDRYPICSREDVLKKGVWRGLFRVLHFAYSFRCTTCCWDFKIEGTAWDASTEYIPSWRLVCPYQEYLKEELR